MKIAVVGSGIGGLAVAIRLANRGHNVTVFEKNPIPGGKISEIHAEGFRFDTGPTVFTMPQYLENLFRDSKASTEIFLKYSKLELNCKYILPSGKIFKYYSDLKKLREEIKRTSHEPFENIEKRLAESTYIHQLALSSLVKKDGTKVKKFISSDYNKLLIKSYKYLSKSIHKINEAAFIDKDIAKVFDNFNIFNGADPYGKSSIIDIGSYTQFGTSRYFIQGGFYSLIDALMALAKEKRINFKFNSPIEKIIIDNQSVTGVLVKGVAAHFDAVVSNADILYSSLKLFKNPDAISLKNRELTYSALVFMWGVKRTSPKLECYNVILGGNTEKEYELLSGRKIISSDPAISIYISSKLNKSDAPINCENWQVRINAPINNGQDWNTQVNQSRILILKRIYETYGIDLKKDIIFEKIATPVSLERDYNCYKGCVHGVHPKSLMSTFSEHPNVSGQIKNLYFVGGSVSPGGNIPMALLSAEIVENIIQKDHPSQLIEPTLF